MSAVIQHAAQAALATRASAALPASACSDPARDTLLPRSRVDLLRAA